MIKSDIFQPLVVLMAWTMVMWVWMYATRIPAMSRNPDIDAATKRGGTGKDLDGYCPTTFSGKRIITTICTKHQRYFTPWGCCWR